MSESIFSNCPGLDVEFLDEAYDNDAETALFLFHQFLDELPTNLDLLVRAFRDYDITTFRKLIHKQKPGFGFVGLTHISNQIDELQSKCLISLDLGIYKKEIEDLFNNISQSSSIIEKAISRLEQDI